MIPCTEFMRRCRPTAYQGRALTVTGDIIYMVANSARLEQCRRSRQTELTWNDLLVGECHHPDPRSKMLHTYQTLLSRSKGLK